MMKMENLSKDGSVPINTDILILLDGIVRVGQFNGVRFVIHSDGLERHLVAIDGWMPMPEFYKFKKNMSKQEHAQKNLLICIIATVVLVVVAWLQQNGILPKI